MTINDNGPQPNAFDIESATRQNENYRTVAWTGKHLQVTLMSIPPGQSIGLESHPDTDQFLRVDAGRGKAVMGPAEDQLDFEQEVSDGWSVQVPAGTWHDVINSGDDAAAPLRDLRSVPPRGRCCAGDERRRRARGGGRFRRATVVDGPAGRGPPRPARMSRAPRRAQEQPGAPRSGAARLAGLWGALAGAALGFGVGAIGYLLIAPVLEESAGWIRELQGFAWNLVPGLTMVGAVVGLILGVLWRRRV